MSEKSDLHREYVLELENELRELEKREESSIRRIQMLVYPAMVAFIILAAYGYYLVQTLTSDVNRMADSIILISNSVSKNMEIISSNTINMSDNMTSLVNSTQSMDTRMNDLVDSTGAMSNNVGSMSENIGVMKDATSNMAYATNGMQQDMWSLNQNISTPLSMFNKFVPWNNNSNGRFPGSRKQPPMYYQQQPYFQPGLPATAGLVPGLPPVIDPATGMPVVPEENVTGAVEQK